MLATALILWLGLSSGEPARDAPLAAARPAAVQAQAGRALNQLLRQSREPGSPSRRELLEQIELLGPDAQAPALQILLHRSIPGLDGAPAQVLSEPQRDLVLDALMRWPAAPTLERLEGELLGPPSFERAWAALHVWGALGDGRQFLRGVELATPHLEGKKRRALLRDAVQVSVERLVRRRPGALADLLSGYRDVHRELRLPLLSGVGATGDARAAELLAHVLDSDEEHAPAALAQVQLIARSIDPDAYRRLCDELRERLASDAPAVRIAALRALGAQRDWRSVEAMLERLEADLEEERTSVLWALRRATGMEWHGIDSWRAWHASEERWREERLDGVLERLASSAQRQVVAALEESATHPLFAEHTAPWAVDALRSPSALVRRSAANALLRLDCPLALPALIDALEDEDAQVAQSAYAAVTALSGLTLPAQAEAWREALRP